MKFCTYYIIAGAYGTVKLDLLGTETQLAMPEAGICLNTYQYVFNPARFVIDASRPAHLPPLKL